MIPAKEAPGPAPLGEAAAAYRAICDIIGKGEATTDRLRGILAEKAGVADAEEATRLIEALWIRGFIYCANAVRGIWRVARP